MNLEPTISFRGGSEGEGVCVCVCVWGGGGGAKLDMLTGHIFRNGQYKTWTAGCGLRTGYKMWTTNHVNKNSLRKVKMRDTESGLA